MIITPDHLFLLHMFGSALQNYLLHQILGIEVRLNGLAASLLFLLALIRLTFALFQSSETSPDHHNLLKATKSSLTMMPARSLSTFGYILPNPTDFCISSLFNYSLIRSSSKSKFSFPTSLMVLGFSKAKQDNQSSADLFSQGPCFIQQGPHIFHRLFLAA